MPTATEGPACTRCSRTAGSSSCCTPTRLLTRGTVRTGSTGSPTSSTWPTTRSSSSRTSRSTSSAAAARRSGATSPRSTSTPCCSRWRRPTRRRCPSCATPKTPTEAIISIPPFKVTGKIHLMPTEGLREALGELTGRFIPVTDAAFWSDRLREPREQASMLAVNHRRAQILAPYQEVDPWAGVDRGPTAPGEPGPGGSWAPRRTSLASSGPPAGRAGRPTRPSRRRTRRRPRGRAASGRRRASPPPRPSRRSRPGGGPG